MPKAAKDGTPDREARLKSWEARLDEREKILNERDRLLTEMPEDFSNEELLQWYDRKRPVMLASMLALATESKSETTRKDLLIRLNDMDMGKPVAGKRDDSGVGVILIERGDYGT